MSMVIADSVTVDGSFLTYAEAPAASAMAPMRVKDFILKIVC